MAKLVTKITLGVDVAKDHLVIYHWQKDEQITLANDAKAIRQFLDQLTGPARLAIEPTSHYHMAMTEAALTAGLEVYLVNPRQLAHYRHAVNVRNKTDLQDAWLLARYLEAEATQLRRFEPRDPKAQRVWLLLKRRATVVSSRQRIRQSFATVSVSVRALMRQFDQLLVRIDHQIESLIGELGWRQDYKRCRSIPGIGTLNAAALTMAYHRGAFGGSDSFVAYLGLDVKIRQSGQLRGQAKLSKQGDAEIRRLLYCASQPARHHERFADYCQRQLDRGRSKIAARVALSRKLARIAFALMQKEEMFESGPKMA